MRALLLFGRGVGELSLEHVGRVTVFTSFTAQQGPLEHRDTCESLSGFQIILGATWASLSTETLVKALAVFESFWVPHGPLEHRGTYESLRGS